MAWMLADSAGMASQSGYKIAMCAMLVGKPGNLLQVRLLFMHLCDAVVMGGGVIVSKRKWVYNACLVGAVFIRVSLNWLPLPPPLLLCAGVR